MEDRIVDGIIEVGLGFKTNILRYQEMGAGTYWHVFRREWGRWRQQKGGELGPATNKIWRVWMESAKQGCWVIVSMRR